MSDLGEYWRDVKEHFRDKNNHPEKYFSKKEIEDYEARCKKREEKSKQREALSLANIKKIATEANLELKVYESTGQYSFGSILDWWTTTGTAIARKSRNRYFIDLSDTCKLKSVLLEEK